MIEPGRRRVSRKRSVELGRACDRALAASPDPRCGPGVLSRPTRPPRTGSQRRLGWMAARGPAAEPSRCRPRLVACGTAAQARDVRAVDGVEHDMQEQRAQRVVVGLRAVGADAHLERVSVYEFGVGVQLPDGRRACLGRRRQRRAQRDRDARRRPGRVRADRGRQRRARRGNRQGHRRHRLRRTARAAPRTRPAARTSQADAARPAGPGAGRLSLRPSQGRCYAGPAPGRPLRYPARRRGCLRGSAATLKPSSAAGLGPSASGKPLTCAGRGHQFGYQEAGTQWLHEGNEVAWCRAGSATAVAASYRKRKNVGPDRWRRPRRQPQQRVQP